MVRGMTGQIDTDPRSDIKKNIGFEWHTLKTLAHYLWPTGQPEMKMRVVLALICLALAKIATVNMPVLLKLVVDALDGASGEAVALPVGLIIAYGVVRVLSIAFAELRDAIFAKVGQRAIRTVALQTFRHLHNLALHKDFLFYP